MGEEIRSAADLAHDFHNVLGTIANYAHFVAEAVGAAAAGDLGQPWAQVVGDVAAIQQATERARGLTDELLALGPEGAR